MSRSWIRALGGALALGALTAACLPGDDRPPPGRILVTAGPSDATRVGFVTDDGWTVRFDRFVTALGNVDLDGVDERRGGVEDEETCNDYSQTNYEWLIDFVAAARGEKVGLVHGLGDCTIEYRLRGPSADTVLGAGTTEADLELMRVEERDAWTEADEEGDEMSLLALGTATRDDVVVAIDWRFRKSFEIRRCTTGTDETDASRVALSEGVEAEVPVEVRAEELFRARAEDDAPLQFAWYAAADGDGDGTVTLEELDAVPVPAEVLPIPRPPGSEDEGDPPPEPETLGDYVVEVLLGRVSRVEGTDACRTEGR